MAKKTSLGRQKIKIAKIQIKNHLQVTFSKRRSGLFKKASELCTLCGVEIAIIVFSPAGKVFSFGHPNVEPLVDRFLITRNPILRSNTLHLVDAHRNASLRELNLQLTQALNEMEAEKKRGETFDQLRRASQGHFWWETPIEKLGLGELEQLRDAMEELKKNVTKQCNKLLVETTNSNNFQLFTTGGNNYFGHIDQFESKPPTQINLAASSNHGHGFGCPIGFF